MMAAPALGRSHGAAPGPSSVPSARDSSTAAGVRQRSASGTAAARNWQRPQPFEALNYQGTFLTVTTDNGFALLREKQRECLAAARRTTCTHTALLLEKMAAEFGRAAEAAEGSQVAAVPEPSAPVEA